MSLPFNPNALSNNSMDVRAKQRLSYQSRSLNLELRGFGFAPRQIFNSWVLCYFPKRRENVA